MSSKFSGALQLTDLDDFIAPSQECIKPIQVQKSESVSIKSSLKKKQIKLSKDGSYVEFDDVSGDTKKLAKAQVTLNDCLACSGCITSAESVLVSQHSHEEFYKVINENKISGDNTKYVVVSVSPQSRASLAVKYGLSVKDTSLALSNFFMKLGVKLVLDTTFFLHYSLQESAHEFSTTFKENKDRLPLLTSSCPGWICYAEKTHGNLLLPHISTVKSAQQLGGAFIKSVVSRLDGKEMGFVYHTTVMPCYDKKLEATREDFYNDIYNSKDVDLVLTTTEVDEMISQEGSLLSDLVDETLFPEESLTHAELKHALLSSSTLLHNVGNGSDGYLEYVFRKAAKSLFNRTIDTVEFKTVRNNKDFFETCLFDEDGHVLLRFGAAYGFRSIQNLVQKIKRKNCKYDYVEVMACPSACLNGGGQIKIDHDREKQKVLLAKVQQAYKEPKGEEQNYDSNSLCEKYLSPELLHTEYHALEVETSSNSGISIKW